MRDAIALSTRKKRVQQAKNAMQQTGFCVPRRKCLEFQLEFQIETQVAATNFSGIFTRASHRGAPIFSRHASTKSCKNFRLLHPLPAKKHGCNKRAYFGGVFVDFLFEIEPKSSAQKVSKKCTFCKKKLMQRLIFCTMQQMQHLQQFVARRGAAPQAPRRAAAT